MCEYSGHWAGGQNAMRITPGNERERGINKAVLGIPTSDLVEERE